ncbi:MAG: YfhO family protein [Elusimicrobia bacterium]|nr:YfhO family protein [Elusimicrobiota bacterium]
MTENKTTFFELVKKHRGVLFAAAAFAAYFLFFWKKVYFSGLLPADGNTLLMSYPDWAIGKKFLRNGLLPLWNPLRNLGEPFLADPKTAILYPPTWLSFLSGYSAFFKLWVLAHTLLAFSSGYLLAEKLFKDRASAVAAGMLAAFNGMMIAKASIPIYFSAFAWLFAAVYFLVAGRTVLLALSLAMQWFAGYPPFSLITFAALLALLPVLEKPAAGARRLCRASLIFLGLIAIQLLPFLEMLGQSARSLLLDSNCAFIYSISPGELLKKLLFPFWYAFSPESEGDPAVVNFYFGFAPLAAAGILLFKKAGKRFFYLLALFAVSLLLCLGKYLPGYELVPFFRVFRYPANWLALGAPAAVLLVGAGFSRLSSRNLRWVLTAIAAFELLAYAQLRHKLWVRSGFFTEMPAVLKDCPAERRIFHSPLLKDKLEKGFLPGFAGDYLLVREAAYPSFGTAFGFGEVSSYQVLASERARLYADRIKYAGPGSELLDYASVGAVLMLKADPAGRLLPESIAIKNDNAKDLCFLVPPGGGVTIEDARPGYLKAGAELSAPAVFVFSQAWYPGWKLKIDGKKAVPEKFEGTFLSCPLSPGPHTIEFRYLPASFIAGLLLSALTLLSLLLYRLSPRK